MHLWECFIAFKENAISTPAVLLYHTQDRSQNLILKLGEISQLGSIQRIVMKCTSLEQKVILKIRKQHPRSLMKHIPGVQNSKLSKLPYLSMNSDVFLESPWCCKGLLAILADEGFFPCMNPHMSGQAASITTCKGTNLSSQKTLLFYGSFYLYFRKNITDDYYLINPMFQTFS